MVSDELDQVNGEVLENGNCGGLFITHNSEQDQDGMDHQLLVL